MTCAVTADARVILVFVRIGSYIVNDRPDRQGGQAFVYFTTSPITGERVAVKVARPSAWSRKRMEREIKVQMKLDHPNVLPILEHGEDLTWYVTRRADQSLDELGAIPAHRWTYLRVGLLGVASAVAYAHSLRYVHRDLAPGNILVFGGGWIVSDWGFVYEPPMGGTRMTQALEMFGTPEFMAPEMAVDPKNVGPAADVFSLGRIAAWGTGLRRGEGLATDDAHVTWWRRLIDGTTAYDPDARWTMRDIETHLRSTPPLAVVHGGGSTATGPQTRAALTSGLPTIGVATSDQCPRCRSRAGSDASERCLVCRSSMAY